MDRKPTKHDTRSAATRAALIDAGRRLFGERGYAAVGTEELVRAAGVTRGALYHQFRDKADLLDAVYNVVEAEITEQIATGALASGATDPLAALRAGARAFLDACAAPEVERIVLLDAPAVLGWGAGGRWAWATRWGSWSARCRRAWNGRHPGATGRTARAPPRRGDGRDGHVGRPRARP